MKLLTILVVGLSVITFCGGCNDDNLWELIACGPKTVHIIEMLKDSNDTYDFCGTGKITTGVLNQASVRGFFITCYLGFNYGACSEMQKKELPTTFIEDTLSAPPCSIVNSNSYDSTCPSEFVSCIYQAIVSIIQIATRGTACLCADKAEAKAAVEQCVWQPSYGSCSDQTNLEATVTQLTNLIDNFDCSGIDSDDCRCYKQVEMCITNPDYGNMPQFLHQAWSLVEPMAVANQNDTRALSVETTRAWKRYQECRALGYPDQLERSVQCITNQAIFDHDQCDVNFPKTLAYAEHEHNTTFYQTWAAAVKNIADFCHVWCRNSTHWTGEMLVCLSSFHPPDMNMTDGHGTENVIQYINNHPDADIIQICNDNPELVDQNLECASNKIKDCPYLAYHILIADSYSFQHTLTTSDAMEAIYKILTVCNKNATSWALATIAKKDDKSNIGGNGDSGDIFSGFFSSSSRFVTSPLLVSFTLIGLLLTLLC